MEAKPTLRSDALFPRRSIIAIGLTQQLWHRTVLGAEMGRHVDELRAAVRRTVGQQSLHSPPSTRGVDVRLCRRGRNFRAL